LILSESEISRSDYLKESLKVFIFLLTPFLQSILTATPSN